MKNFQQLSYLASFGAGLAALAYAYSFIVLRDQTYYSLALMLLGLFGLGVAVALYESLKQTEPGIAKMAVLLVLIGSFGALVHGGYDLANAINPPTNLAADLPSQVDPRGLLTFGIAGIGLLKIGWLMQKAKEYSVYLGWVAILSGALLIWIYIARLTILNPSDPRLLYPVLAEGFIVQPLWYLWLGWHWWNKR